MGAGRAEQIGLRGIPRHFETFQLWEHLDDCAMSETLRDIGATFGAITATKCDMAAVGDGLTAERSEGAEWEPVIAIGMIAHACWQVKCLNCD